MKGMAQIVTTITNTSQDSQITFRLPRALLYPPHRHQTNSYCAEDRKVSIREKESETFDTFHFVQHFLITHWSVRARFYIVEIRIEE